MKYFLPLLFILLLPTVLADDLYLPIDSLADGNFQVDEFTSEIGNATLNFSLVYGAHPSYDANNDGREVQLGVIDFDVSSTQATDNICTRWEIYSVEAATSQAVCYGTADCCAQLQLIPSRYSWNESLYLSHGSYGAGFTNIISAQLVTYNGSVQYGDWQHLNAEFEQPGQDGGGSFGTQSSTVEEDIFLNISSPDNESVISSGEGILLNVSANESVVLNYSLNGGTVVSLENATNFSTILNGSLAFSTLANGNHTLLFGVRSVDTSVMFNYTFVVNDTTTPTTSLNITNGSLLTATYLALDLNISSTEYGNVSSKLNENSFTSNSSLPSDRSLKVSLVPVEGQNNLTVRVTDLQGNTQDQFFSFNFTHTGTCSDALQNGQETGVDCGGSCSSCINLSVTVAQSQYNLSDTVLLTVVSRANSSVNVTVKRNGAQSFTHVFTPAFTGAPISETRTITNTSTAGNYTVGAVMTYLNLTEISNASFDVLPASTSSSLSATISANTTTVDESTPIAFTSSISGNTSTPSYKWDFNNDGTIDSTDANVNYSYTENGTFVVNLTVIDTDGNNQTDLETIKVRKTYNFTITVKDNTSQATLTNATVTFNDIEKNTSAGDVRFTVHTEDHTLTVSQAGYKTITTSIDLSENIYYYANLTPVDDSSPSVVLIGPRNGTTIYDDNLSFTYFLSDSSDVTCTVYTRSTTILWTSQGTGSYVSPNGQSSISVEGLDQGSYEWRVECRDQEGNLNTTTSRQFFISENSSPNELSIDLQSQVDAINQLNQEIDGIIKGLPSLSSKQQKLADQIQLKDTLERNILDLKRAVRDLNSLKWRKLNGTALENETNTILKRIDDIKFSVPQSFSVVDSSEFVAYPQDETLALALDYLINETNKDFSKRQKSTLVETTDALQSLITITTSATIVDFDYLYGTSERATIITKEVQSTIEDPESYRLFEIIPKSVAEHVDDITAYFDYEIIDPDPVIEISLDGLTSYSYRVDKEVDLSETEEISSILLDPSLEVQSGNLITGFVAFNGVAQTVDLRLLVEIIIIIILILVYIVYSLGSVEEVLHVLDPKKVKTLRHLIADLTHHIDKREYDEAKELYAKVLEAYKEIEKKHKGTYKQPLTDLTNRLNVLYINQLLEQADLSIENDDLGKSKVIYAKISALYKIIPKSHKTKVVQKCLELRTAINSHK